MLGDDVRRAARFQAADGDDGGIDRVDFARDEGLDRSDQESGNDDCVGGLVGPGAVPALTLHLDAEAIRLCRDHAAGDHDLADAVMMRDVTAEDGVDAIEHAAVQNHPRAAPTFFSGLKHEQHVGRRRLPGQQRRGAEHHRHVGIVTAGVHLAFDGGGERQVGVLRPGQGVHLGPQRNCRPLGTLPRQAPDHRAAFAGIGIADAETLELLLDEPGSMLFLERKLRMAVKRPPQLDHVRIDGLNVVGGTHAEGPVTPLSCKLVQALLTGFDVSQRRAGSKAPRRRLRPDRTDPCGTNYDCRRE